MGLQYNRPPQNRPPRPDTPPSHMPIIGTPSKRKNEASAPKAYVPKAYVTPLPVEVCQDTDGYYYWSIIKDSDGQLLKEKIRLKRDQDGFYIENNRFNKIYVMPKKNAPLGDAARKPQKRSKKTDHN